MTLNHLSNLPRKNILKGVGKALDMWAEKHGAGSEVTVGLVMLKAMNDKLNSNPVNVTRLDMIVEDFKRGNHERAFVDLGFHFLEMGVDADFATRDEIKNNLARSAKGGKNAAKNRAEVRNKVQRKIKKTIQKQYLWNDATQTTRSITDALWSEIKTAIDSGEGWQGISREDLLQGKVGRNTVQDIVKETDPR